MPHTMITFICWRRDKLLGDIPVTFTVVLLEATSKMLNLVMLDTHIV